MMFSKLAAVLAIFPTLVIAACRNDENYSTVYGSKTLSCSKLRMPENSVAREALCATSATLAACPHSCGTCCEDANASAYTFFQVNGKKSQPCSWILQGGASKDASRTLDYCNGYWSNGSTVRAKCQVSCDFCFDPAPVLTCPASLKETDFMLPQAGPFASIPTPPGPHIAGLVESFKAWTVGLNQMETIYVVRFTHLILTINWNCAAVYSPDWKNAINKQDDLIHAPDTIQLSGDLTVNLNTSDARLLCMASAWATVVDDWVPQASDPIKGYITTFQYPNIEYGYNSRVATCYNENGEADDACLSDLAAEECYAPAVMGAIVAHEVAEFARRDGWNMYGNLRGDGTECVYNCRRYTDPTGYTSVYDVNDPNLKMRWGPLLEDDNAGYFTKQEHVGPHIGSLAKPWTITRAEVEARGVKPPAYTSEDYNAEALLVAERLSNLTDEKKVMIEFFDDKIAVVDAVIASVAMLGASFEQVVHFALGATSADYDATIVAWQEKVRHDLVRPTTWIQDQMSEDEFQSWVKGLGTKTVKGKDFEAYIRVMPHSEYVSGSSCIFQSLSEYTEAWTERYFNISTLAVKLGDFPAGSSKVEPGVTPAEDLTLSVSSMTELRELGGLSRLDGGMHFTRSVSAGNELCEGIGISASVFAFDLW